MREGFLLHHKIATQNIVYSCEETFISKKIFPIFACRHFAGINAGGLLLTESHKHNEAQFGVHTMDKNRDRFRVNTIV